MQVKEVTMKRRAMIIVTLLAMTAYLVPTTQAADEKTAGRVIAHFTKTETMKGERVGVIKTVAMRTTISA